MLLPSSPLSLNQVLDPRLFWFLLVIESLPCRVLVTGATQREVSSEVATLILLSLHDFHSGSTPLGSSALFTVGESHLQTSRPLANCHPVTLGRSPYCWSQGLKFKLSSPTPIISTLTIKSCPPSLYTYRNAAL